MSATIPSPAARTATAPTAAPPSAAPPTPQQQAGVLLGHVAGYMAHRTVEIGLGSGLVRALADSPCATPAALAEACALDPFYVSVWCRAAFGARVLDRAGDGYALAPHMAALLLDAAAPSYVGGMFPLVVQPEMFGRFARCLAGGERMWWDDASPAWIDGVAATGRTFYARLVPGGLAKVPGLAERLAAGCRVVDTACGAGAGVRLIAQTYPACEVVGVDGDRHSIGVARRRIADAGLDGRVTLVRSPLEEMTLDAPADVVVNNISMHECRDIECVAGRVFDALAPGGVFVISDFPFPDTDEGLRSVPGRVMSGIQFFEAQIDDQLLPHAAYPPLLERHGFTGIGTAVLTPVHALTWGFRPDA